MTASLVLGAGCGKKTETPANLNAANKVTNRATQLFYESAEMKLIAEPRNVALPESAAAALPVLMRELMKGPTSKTAFRVFPADTVVRGAYLLPGGEVIVDLGGPTLQKGWETGSHHELIAIESLVQTVVANFPETRRVRLLVNGTPAETLAGQVSLARPFLPQKATPAAR